jgi:3-oxoacyl-[acyl-carrier protein] reductase
MNRQTQQTALLTGASRGLGLEMAIALKKLGYKLIVISRTKPDCDYDTWLKLDLSQPTSLTHEYLTETIGGSIDVFIANAGILSGISPSDYQLDKMELVLNVNFLSNAIIGNFVLENMQISNFGRVVFIGSSAAQTGHPDIMYGATKAAIANLSLSYAHLYGNANITVNCLQPGAMRTSITKDMPDVNRSFLAQHTAIAGPYLALNDAVSSTMNLISSENTINGAVITMNSNAVWTTDNG